MSYLNRKYLPIAKVRKKEKYYKYINSSTIGTEKYALKTRFD